MKNVQRIPLDERLRALSGEPYHPLYLIFVNDFYESLATLDPRFVGVYDDELAPYDRLNAKGSDNTIAEYIYRSNNLPDRHRENVQYKLLIEPFLWLAQQGGAE